MMRQTLFTAPRSRAPGPRMARIATILKTELPHRGTLDLQKRKPKRGVSRTRAFLQIDRGLGA